MKTKLIIMATILLLTGSLSLKAQTPQYTWEYVSSLQNEWLQKICTQGLDTVYIVGRNGLIAKSSDRAATWNKQYPATVQLNDIIFCNHTTGFAVGNKGTILRTTDAGANWTLQNSGITVNLNAIAATGTDNIWAVGDSGKVVFSTNAGETWQKKDFSTLVNLNDVSFRNNTGYIVGNADTCFFTSDRGNSWIFKNIAIENPYNYSLAAFDLLSVNQTQNHVCILIGDHIGGGGWFINVDNNTFLHPAYLITNFTMGNDSIGYGSSTVCITGGSGGCGIGAQIFILNKIDPHSTQYIGASTFSEFDFDGLHSDMSFVNDSIGYLASGSLLYQLKKYISVGPQGLNNVTNNKLTIENNANRLMIRFTDTKVDKIELYNISGLKILSENIGANETSKSIDIEHLSKGIYIIRTYNNENTSCVNLKWIKQ